MNFTVPSPPTKIHFEAMADLATPSGAAMFDAANVHKKPEKPDEEAYKASLKKAEKDHADSMAKLVSEFLYLCVG